MKLSIGCGVLVALVMNANLFEILAIDSNGDFSKILTWQNYEWGLGNFIKTIIGCTLTGLFLSLGSKFWHDLVDLLLQIKNLRKKAVEKET